MASTSYQKVATPLPRKLEPKDLPVLRRLARGLSSFIYETTWQGKRHSRKDFPIGSVTGKSVFEKETKHLFDLDHPNIVKCFGYAIGKNACSLLQEYMDDNLQSIIQKRIELQRKKLFASYSPSRVLSIDEIKGLLSNSRVDQGSLDLGSNIPFSLSETFDIISQIAIGTKYLHDNAIVHGDLKPKNVLMHQGSHGKFEVKINDFGLVGTKKQSRLDSKRNQHLDVLMWKAPELLDELLSPSTKYSNNPFIDSDIDEDDIDYEFKESGSSSDFEKGKLPMADVYSFGLMCSYIVGGEFIHPNLRLIQFQNKKLEDFRPKLHPACPKPLNSLICKCLEFEPLKRPTFSTIVENFATSTLKAYPLDSPNSLEDRLCKETLATTMRSFVLDYALSSAAPQIKRSEFLTYILETKVPGLHSNADDEERLPQSTMSPQMVTTGRFGIADGAREVHMIAGHLQNWEGRDSDNAAMKILEGQGSKGDPFPVSEPGDVVPDGISHSQCLEFLCNQGPHSLIKNLDKETICSMLLDMAEHVKVLPPGNDPLPWDVLNMTLWKASLFELMNEMKTVELNCPSLIGTSGVYVLTTSPYSAFLRALAAEIADAAVKIQETLEERTTAAGAFFEPLKDSQALRKSKCTIDARVAYSSTEGEISSLQLEKLRRSRLTSILR